MYVMCFGPGGRSASSSSPSASIRAHTEGPSELLLETSYYNFYQPSRYPTYYSNLYNCQVTITTLFRSPVYGLVVGVLLQCTCEHTSSVTLKLLMLGLRGGCL